MDLLCFFCLVFAVFLSASVYMCFVVTCWEKGDLLAHFPIGIMGQVWYLIVSIPDLCTLTYFVSHHQDGRQNDRHLSVYTCVYSYLVIYYPISSKFHIQITSIKHSQFEYVFFRWALTKFGAKITAYSQYIVS